MANSGGNSASRTKANFLIQCNGKNTGGCTSPTATALGSSSLGTVIPVGNNGYCDMTGIVNNNAIVATHTPNMGGGNGIAGGNGVAGAGNAWTPQLTLSVTNNTVSGTDGNGILLVGRGTSGFANMKITGNTVGTSVNAMGTARESIRVDAGNAASANDGICATISGNTCSMGSNGAAGIGIRKNGTVQAINPFGLTGLSPSPATGPQAAAYVVTQNPAGNGCDNISGSNFQSCATAPPLMFALGGIDKADERQEAPVTLSVAAARPAAFPEEKPLVTVPAAPVTPASQSGLLKQADLDSVVVTAMARWEATGLNENQLAALHNLRFEVVDLPGIYLGEADGNRIRVSKNAGGNGGMLVLGSRMGRCLISLFQLLAVTPIQAARRPGVSTC